MCVGVRASTSSVPLLEGALEAALRGTRTSADAKLRLAPNVSLAADLDPAVAQLLYDPQTSGGLLAAVNVADMPRLQACGFQCISTVKTGSASVIIS